MCSTALQKPAGSSLSILDQGLVAAPVVLDVWLRKAAEDVLLGVVLLVVDAA
jgi:hypothetical protein